VSTWHMAVDVRGMLTKPLRQFKGMLKHDDGRTMTPHEAREALLDELSKGRDFLPYGKCDNFDYKSGCLGHGTAELLGKED
jgi:hypothetical protein